MQELEFMKVAPSTLFRIILRGCFSFFGPIGILVSFLVLAGFQSVQFNDQPTYGVLGFFIALIMYVGFIPIAVTVMSWIVLSSGFWVYGKYNNLKRRIFEKEE